MILVWTKVVDQLTVVLIPVIILLRAVTKLSWLVLCSVLLSYTDKPDDQLHFYRTSWAIL